MFTSAREAGPAKEAKEAMTNEGGTGSHEKVRPFKEEAASAASAVKEDIEETARRAGRHARDLADSAGQNVNEFSDAVVGRMRKKPMQTAATILGVGFVLGMLFRR